MLQQAFNMAEEASRRILEDWILWEIQHSKIHGFCQQHLPMWVRNQTRYHVEDTITPTTKEGYNKSNNYKGKNDYYGKKDLNKKHQRFLPEERR